MRSVLQKSVLQKAFLEFAAALYLWAKSFNITCKKVNFSNVAGLQHATLLENVHRHWYFSRILTPQIENSFFVQYTQHQWLLLERYTHCCQCEQVLFWPSHKNIIPSIFTS